MPTVVARFEPCKKAPERGTVYYRIYKGHNRRMEFLLAFICQLLLGMKLQGQSGEIIPKLVVSVPR